VAVPEIGQNLHELDWQFLPFRSFFNIFRWGAEVASHPKPSFGSCEPSVLSLSGGPTSVLRVVRGVKNYPKKQFLPLHYEKKRFRPPITNSMNNP
jgi:hypothetical protein